MLHRPTTSNALRQKRQRQRRKAGLVMLKAEVIEDQFAEALILAGRLTKRKRQIGSLGRSWDCPWSDFIEPRDHSSKESG